MTWSNRVLWELEILADTRLYMFNEPNGRQGKIFDLDMGLCSHNDIFLEIFMVQEEVEAHNEALVEGWGELEEQFLQNLGLNIGKM